MWLVDGFPGRMECNPADLLKINGPDVAPYEKKSAEKRSLPADVAEEEISDKRQTRKGKRLLKEIE
eukprot:18437-Eustigmatos_ZCMA.PRE.1